MENTHKAGFVSIIGKPNVGKSTLMNQLVGEKLSIITSKAQTTRHRIMGIINSEEFQIVYSDTPGFIDPKYKLQKSMMSFVETSLEDADVVLFVVDASKPLEENDLVERLKQLSVPMVLVINKVDLTEQQEVMEKLEAWGKELNAVKVIPVAALHGFNTESVLPAILEHIPEHPAFFPKDEITDKTERFFVSEIIREKILLNYEQEIPYATEVSITSFKESEDLIKISSQIMVERDSQKGIIIGKGGKMLKKVGTEARKDIEAFFGKKVFLEQHVKVDKDWRKDEQKLKKYGYKG